MADVMQLQGVLVAATRRTYNGFTNPQGELVAGGVIHSAWLVTDFDSPPSEVRVSDVADWSRLHGAGLGAKVEMPVQLFAKNNRIERKLAGDFEIVTPRASTAKAS